jgi:pyrimidine deaminase RibD-like protein/NTP pyrophosphatase (non-canonical NTP hydrolase)
MPITASDYQYMNKAIELSRRCKSEFGKTSPKVGAVIVKNGTILAESFRGNADPGDHAEFIALEKIASNEIVAGATVYTTLEPCTSRSHNKIPCAERLAMRRVSRVVIGMIDPNPSIRGKGIRSLQSNGIEVDLFPPDLVAAIEDINREFTRHIENELLHNRVDFEFVQQYSARDIDEWYKAINYIYADKNFYRDPLSIFSHLVEVIGGLSQIASGKSKSGDNPEKYLPKAIGWWFALCGKLGVNSVSELLWLKFPGICPYCQKREHDPEICKGIKEEMAAPKWEDLKTKGETGVRPGRLGDWQKMFRRIYKPGSSPEFQAAFARLAEELGELAESIRIFPVAPGYFLSEAADVFAWLMNIQNNIDLRDGKREEQYGLSLEGNFCRAYPDICLECKKQRCICPPILKSTIGRMGHELPLERGLFDLSKIFLAPHMAKTVFRPPT